MRKSKVKIRESTEKSGKGKNQESKKLYTLNGKLVLKACKVIKLMKRHKKLTNTDKRK